MAQRMHIIINPASGQDTPILTHLNRIFAEQNVSWDVSITHVYGDAYTHARNALTQQVDCIAVYGGDGTVVEVAHALVGQHIPLGIIPGGTSNIIAKELGIPQGLQIDDAIRIVATQPSLRGIDVGTMQRFPIVLMLTLGIYADVVKQTKRSMKNIFGQLAYNMSATQHLGSTDQDTYTITIDGNTYTHKAAGVIIANTANIGVPGMSIAPRIALDDGLFDVILIRDASPATLVELAQSTILQQEWQDAIKHWQGKHITVRATGNPSMVYDDQPIEYRAVDITVSPKALSVIVPQS